MNEHKKANSHIKKVKAALGTAVAGKRNPHHKEFPRWRSKGINISLPGERQPKQANRNIGTLVKVKGGNHHPPRTISWYNAGATGEQWNGCGEERWGSAKLALYANAYPWTCSGKYWQTSHKQEHWPSYKVWHTWSPYSPHFTFADGVF